MNHPSTPPLPTRRQAHSARLCEGCHKPATVLRKGEHLCRRCAKLYDKDEVLQDELEAIVTNWIQTARAKGSKRRDIFGAIQSVAMRFEA